MKEIKAVIQPFMLDAVLNALHSVGNLPSVVVSQADAVDVTTDYRSAEVKVKVELMVPDAQAEQVVGAIREAAHTGNPGDGRIFIIPIEESVLIRTGERGEASR